MRESSNVSVRMIDLPHSVLVLPIWKARRQWRSCFWLFWSRQVVEIYNPVPIGFAMRRVAFASGPVWLAHIARRTLLVRFVCLVRASHAHAILWRTPKRARRILGEEHANLAHADTLKQTFVDELRRRFGHAARSRLEGEQIMPDAKVPRGWRLPPHAVQ